MVLPGLLIGLILDPGVVATVVTVLAFASKIFSSVGLVWSIQKGLFWMSDLALREPLRAYHWSVTESWSTRLWGWLLLDLIGPRVIKHVR